MTTNDDGGQGDGRLHVVVGTGPVGLAVADELAQRGRRVRVVIRSGRVVTGDGVEVLAGDVTDRSFARTAGAGAAVVSFALNPLLLDASAFDQAFGERATPLDEAIRSTVGWHRGHRPAH